MAARRKPNPGQDKKQAKKAPPPSSGGTLFSTLVLLAILVGVGYAVVRIPVGERTIVEHASSWVQKQFRTRPRPVRPNTPKKEAVAATNDEAGGKSTVKAEIREPAKADAKAPAKTDTKTASKADTKSATQAPAEAKAMDRAIAKLAVMDPKAAKQPASAPPAHPGFSPDEKKALDKLLR